MKASKTTKGIQSLLIPLDILEPIKDLTNKEIADKTGYSIHIVKKSLAHHGLYKGKTYTIFCEACQQNFASFDKKAKFCSNTCKHNKQKIWNTGLKKENNEILMSFSKRMLGNNIGSLANKAKTDISYIDLPNLQISIAHDNKSSIEKNWLLQIDQEPGIRELKRSDLILKYQDDFSVHNYFPDFEVVWETGVRWLVEIKGMCTDADYNKFQAASSWCRDNGYQYRLITSGNIKLNNWSLVYSHPKNIKMPSIEWVFMNNAVTWAALSPSPRRGVGAVIVSRDMRSTLSYGYNGPEKDAVDCPTTLLPGKDGFIHAEENALIKLSSKEPSKMFVTCSPCLSCAKKIINAGTIEEVYYLKKYRDLSGVGLLIQNGIKVYHFQIINHVGKSYTDNEAFELLCPAGLKEIDLISRV